MSPKSKELPNVEIWTYSIIFVFATAGVFVVPNHQIHLVEEQEVLVPKFGLDKSPKSIAFPSD